MRKARSIFMEAEVDLVEPDLMVFKLMPVPGGGQPVEFCVTVNMWKMLESVANQQLAERNRSLRDEHGSGLRVVA